MTLTLEEVEAKIAEYTELRKKLAKENGGEAIAALFAPLWEFPGITASSWTQYTPYFNDGDPCEFHVYADEMPVWVNGLKVEDYSIPESIPNEWVDEAPSAYYTEPNRWSGGDRMNEWREYQASKRAEYEAWKSNGWTTEMLDGLRDARREISRWLDTHEDFLFDVYGDHVEVTVTPDGATADEYEHD